MHKLEIEDSRNHFYFLKEADHKPIYFEDDNFIFVSMNLGGLVFDDGIYKTINKTIKKTIKKTKKFYKKVSLISINNANKTGKKT